MLISISEAEACIIISSYLRSKGIVLDDDVRPADLMGGETSFIFYTELTDYDLFKPEDSDAK